MSFYTHLWQWYGQDEYQKVLSVCEAIPALTFLAMSPDEQRNAIPYCPACETWSEVMLPLNEAITICGTAMPAEARSELEKVWGLCNALSEDAFHCDDWWIFDHTEWQPLRTAAEQALAVLEADQLRPYLDEVTLDCRNAVNGR